MLISVSKVMECRHLMYSFLSDLSWRIIQILFDFRIRKDHLWQKTGSLIKSRYSNYDHRAICLYFECQALPAAALGTDFTQFDCLLICYQYTKCSNDHQC